MAETYEFAPYRMLPSQRQLVREGVPIKLGARAFDVLAVLIERRDRIVSKSELMDMVWPTVVVEENNLEVQIAALRKVLGYAAIATVPGRGYRFTLPVVQTGTGTDSSHANVQDLPSSSTLIPANPPAGVPTLFGREEDLQSLLRLLSTCRLVTVAGPAGVGKTRLAQAAADACAKTGVDRVWWIDLAPMTDCALLPNALAIALGLNLNGDVDAHRALEVALREGSPLVVLDNAEHLLEGVASFVLRLRQNLPCVRFLITSQEPLHVDDEFVFRLEPLSLPTGDDPERIAASGAVALFVARAQAADRRFVLRTSNQAVVAEICQRLDGIPLAIELAAARVSLLGIDGLRDKLDQRFHVLTAGQRSSPRRHQTLRAALEWSHQLLLPAQQAVLRRLGVFAGGFTLEAALQVAEDEQGIDRWDVLEHLGALVEKSLVVAEGDAIPRYRMLETIRLFALERLIESEEADEVRGRHRDHYLVVAEECERNLLFVDGQLHLKRLDVERENLFLALAWAPRADDARLGLRLAAAMQEYWFMRAMPARGAEVTRAALERPGADVPSPERCRALLTAGWMSMWAGVQVDAVRYLTEALALARGLSMPRLLCLVLTRCANVHLRQNELAAAASLASEALDVGRAQGDSAELGYALMLCAHVNLAAQEHETAMRLYLEALGIRERLNIASGTLAAHLSIARLMVDQNQSATAKSHLQRALALVSRADSQYEGLALIAMTAEWAAATGSAEVAMLLSAASARQFRKAGFSMGAMPRGAVERIEGARLSLSSDLAEQLAKTGAALDYNQSLQRVEVFLTENP